jgi:hypothetical protein
MAVHAFGLLRQKPETLDRDHKLFSPRRITDALPDEFDLSVSDYFDKVPQLDQGGLGSCGPNTADECIMEDQIKQGLVLESASRLFIYYITRLLMGTIPQDSGVNNRTMLKALNKYGFCKESLWPYSDDPVKFRQQPPQACFDAAVANRIVSYDAVQISLSQMQGILYTTRRPILFGFDVFRQIESQQASTTGVLTVPSPGETPIGGHDVSLVGWSKKRGMFKFRNHWMNGPSHPWGENGYGWIPYDYATNPNLASDCWAINAVPGGVLPPPPAPPTPPIPVPVPPPGPVPPGPLPPSPHGLHSPAVKGQLMGVNVPAIGGETFGVG